mmetsp:Transcript_28439/g.69333  ORF Transcript_28439/g.69333 Transcript_28439/m.69333 type:complete len:120 (+) Transcript_28439:220-579(+)
MANAPVVVLAPTTWMLPVASGRWRQKQLTSVIHSLGEAGVEVVLSTASVDHDGLESSQLDVCSVPSSLDGLVDDLSMNGKAMRSPERVPTSNSISPSEDTRHAMHMMVRCCTASENIAG